MNGEIFNYFNTTSDDITNNLVEFRNYSLNSHLQTDKKNPKSPKKN